VRAVTGLFSEQIICGDDRSNRHSPHTRERAGLRVRLGRRFASDLASRVARTEGTDMTIQGRVHNGVVGLEGAPSLPDGAEVTVSYRGPKERRSPAKKRKIKVPLVRTGKPGSLKLTNDRIAQILQEEEFGNFGK
jgi:hypothetical protein